MIKVLLFAQLQEAVGESEITIEKPSMTVSEIKQYMKEEHKLHGLENAMVAINEEYADEAMEVKTGDTVAFIPPVSGG